MQCLIVLVFVCLQVALIFSLPLKLHVHLKRWGSVTISQISHLTHSSFLAVLHLVFLPVASHLYFSLPNLMLYNELWNIMKVCSLPSPSVSSETWCVATFEPCDGPTQQAKSNTSAKLIGDNRIVKVNGILTNVCQILQKDLGFWPAIPKVENTNGVKAA